ncbi:hypothetical protein SAY86_000066 [Trapa natans]|uniref:Pentatricopeptide repeat-containing protein n=1 Tax=Trapa natans TaxID=22666 RepID=A0AAN7N0P7_TRANT|nr:hypothetical protein SAY86_000066 [Trapa natans]
MCEMGINWVDKATLTTVLSGCDRQELCHVTELIHGMVLKGGFYREIPVGNALITSYFNCESSDSGRRVFDEMCDRNVITWTAVITGLVQYELYKDALKLFVEMRSEAAEPNLFTYLSFITACSGLRDVKEGSQIHGLIWKLGFQSDLCIESALMDMYSKCGKLDDAWDIFESAETVDEVSMTVILVGFARNGLEEEAVQMFVKVLRAGFEVDSNVISAILGGDSEMGKFAFEKLLSAAPENSAPYVLMANIFSSEGKWRDRARTIQRMKEVGIAKETGISWIEIEKEVHSFVVDDRMHPQSQDILRVLRELFVFMADEGYVPDKRFILYYLEDREIVDNVHHSL